jgi:hypothetical protein
VNSHDVSMNGSLQDVAVSVVVNIRGRRCSETRASGNVPEARAVYNAAGAGSSSVMDTNAKAVRELLGCSGWAGYVRGWDFSDMRLRHL